MFVESIMVKGKRAPRMKRAKAGRRGLGKKVNRRFAKAEFASAKQIQLYQPMAINTVYFEHNINLGQFDRLKMIAQAYQYYRITKITLRFRPVADTYTSGSATAGSLPYLYWLIDKGENFNGLTFNQMRDAGARPIRFDEKTLTVSWRPTVLDGVKDDTVMANALGYQKWINAPWLATSQDAGNLPPNPNLFNVSTVPHHGIIFGILQNNVPSAGPTQWYLEREIQVQFRKPRVAYSVNENPPDAVDASTLLFPEEDVVPPEVGAKSL